MSDRNFSRFIERTAGRLTVDSIVKHKPNSPKNKGPIGRVLNAARLSGAVHSDRYPGEVISLGLNSPCKCGSGKKSKRCCLKENASVASKAPLIIDAAVSGVL
jgi:hypothetical protein